MLGPPGCHRWDGGNGEVWTLPTLELPQSFLQDAGESTPDLHTPGSSHIIPIVSCRSRCAKPKLCRARQGESKETSWDRSELPWKRGNLGKADPGGAARVGIDGRRHHGLPSAVSSRGDLRVVDNVTSPPASHLTCPGMFGEVFAPPAAHTAFVGLGLVKSVSEGSDAQGLPFTSLRVAAAVHRDAGGATAPCDTKTCFGGSKTRSTAAHPHTPSPALPRAAPAAVCV